MKELIILYYGSFAILGDRVREYAWWTSCSNCIVDWTLRSQIFLKELRREHPGWTTAQRQEWGLFLLEHLLHYADSMRKKECQWCSQRPQAEGTKEAAPETFPKGPAKQHQWGHHSDGCTSLQRGVDLSSQHSFPVVSMTNVWGNCGRSWTARWLELAYEKLKGPQEL